MYKAEGNGITGIIITILLYISFMILSCLVLYEYLIHIHHEGKLLDLWRKINAPAEEFFIPHDFEISFEELMYICYVSTQSKALDGSMRNLHVIDFFFFFFNLKVN